MNQIVVVMDTIGFISRYVIDNLLARDFHVRALTHTAHVHVDDSLTWVCDLLEDAYSLSGLVTRTSAVVRCAGQVYGHKEETFTCCNVDGSLCLMRAAEGNSFCQ